MEVSYKKDSKDSCLTVDELTDDYIIIARFVKEAYILIMINTYGTNAYRYQWLPIIKNFYGVSVEGCIYDTIQDAIKALNDDHVEGAEFFIDALPRRKSPRYRYLPHYLPSK